LEPAVKGVVVLVVEHQMVPQLRRTLVVGVAEQEEIRPLVHLRTVVAMVVLDSLL
jgi:hypothetical protein